MCVLLSLLVLRVGCGSDCNSSRSLLLFTLHHIHGRKFENELRFSGLEQLIAWTPFLMLLSSFRPKYIFNNYIIFFRFFVRKFPFIFPDKNTFLEVHRFFKLKRATKIRTRLNFGEIG